MSGQNDPGLKTSHGQILRYVISVFYFLLQGEIKLEVVISLALKQVNTSLCVLRGRFAVRPGVSAAAAAPTLFMVLTGKLQRSGYCTQAMLRLNCVDIPREEERKLQKLVTLTKRNWDKVEQSGDFSSFSGGLIVRLGQRVLKPVHAWAPLSPQHALNTKTWWWSICISSPPSHPPFLFPPLSFNTYEPLQVKPDLICTETGMSRLQTFLEK